VRAQLRLSPVAFILLSVAQSACLYPVAQPVPNDAGCRACGDGGIFNSKYGDLSGCSSVLGSLSARGGQRKDFEDAQCLEVVTQIFEVSSQFDTLRDLSGLTRLTRVGHFSIDQTRGLRSLDGVPALRTVQETIGLSATKGLSSIEALRSVDDFEGDLVLIDNEDLASLAGLEKVRVLKAMTLLRNAKLSSLDGLSGLVEVKGDVDISSNPSLPEADVTRFLQRVKVGGRIIRR
jgi:hypothetical protein